MKTRSGFERVGGVVSPGLSVLPGGVWLDERLVSAARAMQMGTARRMVSSDSVPRGIASQDRSPADQSQTLRASNLSARELSGASRGRKGRVDATIQLFPGQKTPSDCYPSLGFSRHETHPF